MTIFWDVKIGHNWGSYSVKAKDFIKAGKKALGFAKKQGVDSANNFVSEVNLARNEDGSVTAEKQESN